MSFFLLGPRQTGKTTLVRTFLGAAEVWEINLLKSETYYKYLQEPARFRNEVELKIKNEDLKTVFIDEVQRVPDLLNEVQYIMDNHACRFILTGSSARKLKRGGANLLGGRALERYLFPLTANELQDKFNLEIILRYGSLPSVVLANKETKIDILGAYVNTYLREEIQAEGIVRNMAGFSKFLEVAANQSGDIVNFSSIGRDVSLAPRTVQSYYEILEETLIGFRLESYSQSPRKRLIGHPKFYIFDMGVISALNHRLTAPLNKLERGKLFEHFIILETNRLISYSRNETRMFFWHTNHGAEVDLIIEKHGEIKAAFEVKFGEGLAKLHLTGLASFREDHPNVPCFVVCNSSENFTLDFATVLTWRNYFKYLEEKIL